MNTAVIITKTDPEIKAEAQKIAKELGFNLSALVNGWLRQLIKTKTVTFSASDEEPSEYLLSLMKQADEDYKKGNTSPALKSGKDAVAWLEKQGI
jgi:addiction module RelB/DinJ family antitoxin